MNRGAIFTEGKRHRTLLIRDWDVTKPTMTAIMLNPSKADAERDDPTTTFMVNIAKREGYGKYYAVNLHDFVGTDPEDMKKILDPVSDFNDFYIARAVDEAELVVVAWGTHGNFMGRADEVMKKLSDEFAFDFNCYCFGKNNDGSPKFPRALKRDVELIKYHYSEEKING